ncbi:helix-turn-helix domain-containing protein [Bacillus sp. JJ722]|uniref:helix-turn-helix domain-containing protein n=1 Tax=Bacillus sp. JJ722 TaxID=3122973 RepID=UPI003F68B136
MKAKKNSISTASKRLHVTRPTISQSISQLESELGVTLYTRSSHGTKPTPKGKFLSKTWLK